MTQYTPSFGEDSLGVIFQGQNVNRPGMGRLLNKFEAAKKVYDAADEVLDFDVREVCFGSLTHLQEEPEYVQPAIVVTELAEYRAWQDFTDGIQPDLVTGLSLGMYAALAAVESVDDTTAMYISAQRAKLVGRNAKRSPGGMVSIKGLPHQEALDDILSKTKTGIGIWWGSHGLVTLSGTRARVRKAERIANSIDGVTAELSKVKEGAHNIIQIRTRRPLIRLLEPIDIKDPQLPLLSNDPRKSETVFLRNKAEIVRHLADQMVEPVDMSEVNEQIVLSGIVKVLEIGSDRDFGLTSQLIRKSREDRIRDLREQMGRGVIKRAKFDYEALSA